MNHEPLTVDQMRDLLVRVRDFALKKAAAFVEQDDPTRPVIDVTRATRLQALISTADQAHQMMSDLAS